MFVFFNTSFYRDFTVCRLERLQQSQFIISSKRSERKVKLKDEIKKKLKRTKLRTKLTFKVQVKLPKFGLDNSVSREYCFSKFIQRCYLIRILAANELFHFRDENNRR